MFHEHFSLGRDPIPFIRSSHESGTEKKVLQSWCDRMDHIQSLSFCQTSTYCLLQMGIGLVQVPIRWSILRPPVHAMAA